MHSLGSTLKAMSDDLILVQNLIHEIRGKKVMLDFDLARLYQVETKALNQAVKRNMLRFPPDFMFQLTAEEVLNMRSQIVTSSKRHTSDPPFAFTEQGVAMLSGVLKSPIAIAARYQQPILCHWRTGCQNRGKEERTKD